MSHENYTLPFPLLTYLFVLFVLFADTDSVQMLQRSTQVGEYYRMAAPKVFQGDLPPHYMDIIIYDEEQDKHVHITFESALRAAIHNADPALDPNNPGTDGPVGGFFGSAVLQTAAIAGQPGGAVVPNTVAGIMTNIRASPAVWMPLEVIIARPFIEHLMMSAVLAVSGRDTGATLFGPAGKSLHHILILSLLLLSHIHTHSV